jgi:hypothetical protein
LEYQFRRIATLARCRNKDLFFGLAGYIEDKFSPNARKVLFRLLNKIEEDIPWRGIDYSEIFSGKDKQ